MSEKVKAIDKRTVRTKMAIKEALAELLATKDIDSINVVDISQIAGISRKTFYYYYQGIWELVDEIEKEITDVLLNAITSIDFRKAIHNPSMLLAPISEFFSGSKGFYRKLIQNDHNFKIWDTILVAMKKKAKATFQNLVNINENDFNLMIEFYLDGLFGAFKTWTASEDQSEINHASALLSHLIFEGVSSSILPGVLEKGLF